MKTVEEKQKEINDLSDKMRELRGEIQNDIKVKYKHLIGKCFKPNDHTYFMIRSIREVYKSDITVEGLAIHTHLKDRQTPMKFNAFSFLTEDDLKETQITKEEFSKQLDKVVAEIKKEVGL